MPSFPVPNGTGDFSHALMKYPREAAYRRKGLFALTAPEGGGFQVVEPGSRSMWVLVYISGDQETEAGW